MNAPHLHLLLNHVPIIGTYFMILLLVVGLLRKSSEMTRGALLGFGLLAVAAIVVFLTGEPAEEAVEHLAGVSTALIEPHEEAALTATILLLALGALSVGGLMYFNRRAKNPSRAFLVVVLLFSLIPALAMAWTAYQGGQIRHPEISDGSAEVLQMDEER